MIPHKIDFVLIQLGTPVFIIIFIAEEQIVRPWRAMLPSIANAKGSPAVPNGYHDAVVFNEIMPTVGIMEIYIGLQVAIKDHII